MIAENEINFLDKIFYLEFKDSYEFYKTRLINLKKVTYLH